MTTREERPSDVGIAELRTNIEQTRGAMGSTLTAIETRLNPDTLTERAHVELEQLEARLKSVVKEGIEEAKVAAADTVKEGLVQAKESVSVVLKEGVEQAKTSVSAVVKEGIDHAKEAVTHGLKEARETVKSDVRAAIDDTKRNVREATLGRLETFATKTGDVMTETRDTLVETIRRNPIPAALAGVGIVWLLMNRSSSAKSRDRYYATNPYGGSTGGTDGFGAGVQRSLSNAGHAVTETAGKAAQRLGDVAGQVGSAFSSAGTAVTGAAHDATAAAKDAAGRGADFVDHLTHQTGEAASRAAHAAQEASSNLLHGASDAAGQFAHGAQDFAGQVATTARTQAKRVEGGVASAWDANPLAFGAVAAVAGIALGYALPRTAKEDELLGEVRDRVVHEVAERATEAVHSLQHVAEDAGRAAKDAVTSSAS